MGEAEDNVQNGDVDSNTTKSNITLTDLLAERIVNQIEYYFGDVNLTRDKFLIAETKKDDGWVPMETMLKFNRLASICSDADIILQALSKSSLMEINDDKTKIRRLQDKPMPEVNEDTRKEQMKRTVYCKGFPQKDITLDDLIPFFKGYGKVDTVIMRHYLDKATNTRVFKGSVFVMFTSVEEADTFLKIDEVKYQDKVLLKKWQSDYITDKRQEYLQEKLNKQSRRRENKKKQQNKGEEENRKEELPSGAVVHVTGFTEDIHREEVKEAIEKTGFPVAYVDYSKGDTSGWVRLEHENTAKEFVEKLENEEDGKLKVSGAELEVRVLEGEEEKLFLDRVKKEMLKRRQMGGRKKKNRGGGRGGHFAGKGRKRKGTPEPEEEPEAKIKAEEL